MTSYTWTGGDNGSPTDFSDAGNWAPPGGPPGPADDATISDSGTLPSGDAVQITQGTEVNNLTIDDGAVNDTGFLLKVDTNLVVGGTSTNDGIPNSLLSIGGGGEIDAAFLDIGQGAGANGGSVTVDASTLKVGNYIVVGDSSPGQLFLFDNASVTAGTFISVGLQSGGQLSINNSTVTLNTTTSGMNVGVDAGSAGNVELNNNALLSISTFLSIGQDGQGTLGIYSGSVVNVGPQSSPIPPGTGDDLGIGVGNNLNGFGQVYVDGNDSELNVSRSIFIGEQTSNGGNLLQITDGAVVNVDVSGDGQVENFDGVGIAFEPTFNQVLVPPGTVPQPSSTPEDKVAVDGLGSELSVNGTIVVGVNGVGELDVSDGAAVVASDNFSGGVDVGVSGAGQGAGSQGTINVESGSSFTAGNLKVGDGGTGVLQVVGDSSVSLGNDLAIGAQAGSNGTVQVGDVDQSPDTSTLSVSNINVGGDFGGPGGNGLLQVEDAAVVSIASELAVYGASAAPLAADPLGTVDLTALGTGAVVVGAFPDGEDASQFPGDLVLNPGGTLDLDNGLIKGGTLFFNGGTLDVTPALDQIDDQHSVLQDVTIEGQDLSVANAVLTLAGGTHGDVFGEGGFDNVLIDATGSLIDLRDDSGTGIYDLEQIINATDIALTVDVGAAGILSIGPTGNINGTGALFSDYISPSSDGFFSGDVDLQNNGLVDAVYNDASSGLPLSEQAQLSILTNTITNESGGIFRADGGATLNIGNDAVLLDATHVFTNLQDNGDGTTSLVDGAYEAFGGNIDINGSASGGPLGPISTLEAVLYLGTGSVGSSTGNGDLFVNGTDIESSLTTITPTSDSGEGNLILLNITTNWNNPIEIQGLTSAEETNTPSWNLEDGTSGQGGGLYLQNATFNGPELTIDGANPSDPGSAPAFINVSSGNGNINAPVTMNGYVSVFNGSLEFGNAVTGTDGQYFINATDSTNSPSELFFNQSLTGTGNTVTFTQGSTQNALLIGPSDLADDFQATIQDFAATDVIDVQTVHAVSAIYVPGAGSTGVLELEDTHGIIVGTLQLADTVFGNDTQDQFAVTTDNDNFYTRIGGGTEIRLADPSNPGPVITSADGAQGTVTEVSPLPDTVPAVQTISDTLSFTDSSPGTVVADGSDSIAYTAVVESDPALGSLSTVVVPPGTGETNGSIDLNYTVSDDAIAFLSAGEQRTDTFYVELSDGLNTTVQPYTVTINGSNQAPVIGNIDLPTSGFSLDGTATVSTAVHPDDTTGGNLYNLLPTITSQPGAPEGSQGQAGAIWAPVSLAQNFTLHAELFFGTSVLDPFNGGSSDGLTFTLQAQGPNAIGSGPVYFTSGGFLGIGGTPPGNTPPNGFVSGITDAMGVKFDTFNNGPPEPNGDLSFAQFFTNGDSETPPVANPDQINTGNLDNGSWHDLVATWNAATDQLTYTLDGTYTDTITENTSVFGSSQVFAGFTGASGSAYSPEQVEIVSFSNGTQAASAYGGAVTDVAGLTSAQVAADNTPLAASGVIDFTDVNQDDTHSVSVPPADETVASSNFGYSGPVLGTLTAQVTHDTDVTDNPNGTNGTVAWNFSVADSAIAFLHAGQQIQEDFVVDVADNHGGVTPQTIAITITGSQNVATFGGTNTGSVTQFGTETPGIGTETATGAVTVTDPDSNENFVQPETNVVDNYGTFSITAAGAWTFTLNDSSSGVQALNPGQVVVDPIAITSQDGTATEDVNITITGSTVTPVANNDTYSTDVGTALSASSVLSNDTDALGHTLFAELLSSPSDGAAFTFNSDGTFSYTPKAAFVGTDTFTYEAVDTVDNKLVSAPATVTITVNDTPPTADPQSYTTTVGSELIETAANGVLVGDADANHPTLTAQEVSGPSDGSLVLNTDGSFTYTPDAAFVGTDSFKYESVDSHGTDSSSATVTITVNDTSPTALAHSYTTTVGTELTETPATGVLVGDADANHPTLTAQEVSGPSDGSLVLNANGSFTYTPDAAFVGTDSFKYESVDSHGTDSSPATVSITVNDTPPTANGHTYSTTFDTASPPNSPVNGNVLTDTNDADANHILTGAAVVSGPADGNLSFNTSTGAFTYTPYLGFIGHDSFTYDSIDSYGTASSSAGTIGINVTDAPNTFDFSQNVNSSLNWTINLSGSTETAFNSKTGTQTLSGDNNVVAGSGNNTIIGNNNSDVLIGGSGNDTIKAGNGNAVIAGGGGTNSMVGGTGHDTFVFTPESFTDTIASFNVNNDQLDFQSFAGLTAQNLNNQILADVTSAHSAASTVIQVAPTEDITLVGVTYNQLAASHPFELNV